MNDEVPTVYDSAGLVGGGARGAVNSNGADTGLSPLRLYEAADAIAAWAGGAWRSRAEGVYALLVRAAEEGRLRVRHPETLLPEVYSEWPSPSSAGLVCTREDLNAWLEKQGVPYRFQAGPQPPAPKPVPRQRAQEEAILTKLAELGCNAQALPVPPRGKALPEKGAVRKALGYSTAVMDKAWQRLRADGRIKDAPR